MPYDVVYESEVREFIEQNPHSFLRVTRSEADFPPDAVVAAPDIFDRAKHNLKRFISKKIFEIDPVEAVYVYQLASGSHVQTGLVACCSLDEYEQGLIKKHENIRPDKVEDRTGHLLATRAQTGLIFLAFRATDAVRSLFANAVEGESIYSFECPDGIRQRVWRITDTDAWVSAMSDVPTLYIADGYHRAESAKITRDVLRDQNPKHTGAEDYNFVVAGMFPAEDLRILAYNRVIKDLNGLSDDEFFERLLENFIVSESSEKLPQNHGEFCMYMGGKWYKLLFNVASFREPDPVERLDVTILQRCVLEPILGISDARTDKRIGFVGGTRGTAELERVVDDGTAKLAFSMFPTTMDDLLAVSDMGEIMPPKSTWFEPKLKDGLLVHII